MKYFQFLLFLLLKFNIALGAVTVTLPDGGTEVAAGNPFSIHKPNTARFQQVYGAAAFASIEPGGGWITAISFRDPPGQPPPAGYIPELVINFSITPRQADGLSAVFTENVGINETQVIGPDLAFYGHNPMPLDQPFFYDPAVGNLLMDVTSYGTESYLFNGAFLAAIIDPNDLSSAVFAVGSGRVIPDQGLTGTAGLVTTFHITQVPEPGTGWLLAFGLPAVLLMVRRGCCKH